MVQRRGWKAIVEKTMAEAFLDLWVLESLIRYDLPDLSSSQVGRDFCLGYLVEPGAKHSYQISFGTETAR